MLTCVPGTFKLQERFLFTEKLHGCFFKRILRVLVGTHKISIK